MRVLIIGLGSIAHKHISALRQIEPNVILYALRSSKKSHQELGVKNIYSLDELGITPDFIIISNPSSSHFKSIKDCLKLQVPLFIEKPVISDLNNSEQLESDIINAGIITYVACNMRFHPAINYLKAKSDELIDQINEVSIYCGSYLPEWRPGTDFRSSYSVNSDMGGGVHLDLIHELDYITWIFGPPDIIFGSRRNVSSLGIEASDQAHYQLQYQRFSVYLTLNYFRRDVKREIELVLDDDTVQIDLIKSKIIKKCSNEILLDSYFEMTNTYKSQFEYFINCIDNQVQPMNSFSEGLRTLKIALHEQT